MKRLSFYSKKNSTFSESQIQAKIGEFWKQRGYVGNSPIEDREKAIAALQAESLNKKNWEQFGNKDDREFALKLKQFQWERIKTIISAFGLGATAIAAAGLFFTYLNAQREQQLNTERLITDRFTKAVEQLGHQDIAVRIGGIYALERIAKDSPKDHWTVMEILIAFVRERSVLKQIGSSQRNRLRSVPTDVQFALTAISRRKVDEESDWKFLNLQTTNLVAVDLFEANLQEANLSRTNLQWANLIGANLQRANFFKANLQKADLGLANLQRASLIEANLQESELMRTDLSQARLSNANLRQADLSYANLQRASLPKVAFEQATLFKADLQEASLWQANFQGAVLERANLRGAIIDEQQIERQFEGAKLCQTTMPDGTMNNRDCKKLEEFKK